MRLTGRNAGLALAALLILVWAVARHRSGLGAIPTAQPTAAADPAPTVPVAARAAPPPAAPIKTARRALAAKAAAPPATPAPVRGAMLREKGEAFGGTTPDRR